MHSLRVRFLEVKAMRLHVFFTRGWMATPSTLTFRVGHKFYRPVVQLGWFMLARRSNQVLW